jgi:hypothetical protein
MSMLYKTGAFFYYFGLAVTIVSTIALSALYSLFASAGVALPSILADYAKVLAITSIIGTLLSILTQTIVFSSFSPLSIWITTQFTSAYAGITSVVVESINLMPLPPVLKAALATAATIFVSASVVYFFMAKLGIAPML